MRQPCDVDDDDRESAAPCHRRPPTRASHFDLLLQKPPPFGSAVSSPWRRNARRASRFAPGRQRRSHFDEERGRDPSRFDAVENGEDHQRGAMSLGSKWPEKKKKGVELKHLADFVG
ncbi:hypothetical protein MRX96_045148 [Rhipicephalus microplus]